MKPKKVNNCIEERCEESIFDLIHHFNINPHRRTIVKGLYLNS